VRGSIRIGGGGGCFANEEEEGRRRSEDHPIGVRQLRSQVVEVVKSMKGMKMQEGGGGGVMITILSIAPSL